MRLMPAIDIRDGKCVRLIQGDPNRQTVYADDPVEQAKFFEDSGAEIIHVVDLDGAFAGKPVNNDLVLKIAKSIKIPIEIGGGIRTPENAKVYLEGGIRRIIAGTAILGNIFDDFIEKNTGILIAGVDARNGFVATHGWLETSELSAIEFIKSLKIKGINEVIFTDISTDGMLEGPNISSLERILAQVPGIKLIASGGVSRLEDIIALKKFADNGIVGVIVGKAIYDGRINIKDALEILRK